MVAIRSEDPRVTLRVLMVEDSADDADLIMRTLARCGYSATFLRVDRADDLRRALAERSFDLVLADYALPGFDALDALAILHESGHDLPFIIVSGSVGEETAVAAMRAGAHDFFLKDRLSRLGSAIDREVREAQVRTERKIAVEQLEESERRLREAVVARDEFLSIASHELRTPLTPLKLHVESARKVLVNLRRDGARPELGPLDSKLEKAERCVTRLAILVGNLLDVTRITADRVALDRQEVDLGEVVADVTERLREAVNGSGSELRVKTDGLLVGSWDPVAIESVVVNLLSNAIKFGRGQPIEIVIERRVDRAVFSVIDQGLGIAVDEQERIFERFERAVPPQHYGGFGIGLWIVRAVVEAHGGTIRVTSKQDVGSTFVVELPLE